jgi:hypothetical protein
MRFLILPRFHMGPYGAVPINFIDSFIAYKYPPVKEDTGCREELFAIGKNFFVYVVVLSCRLMDINLLRICYMLLTLSLKNNRHEKYVLTSTVHEEQRVFKKIPALFTNSAGQGP